MDIIPYVAEQPVTASMITVQVNPDDRARAEALVTRTRVIVAVTDNDGFVTAKRVAGELKALVDEIQDSRKAAKRPFAAVGKAIDDVASQVGEPVQDEHSRILGLLNGYVGRLEAAAKEEQRKKDEALAQQIAQQQAKLREAQEARAKAEAQARAARDELARAQAQEALRRSAQAAEEAQLAAEMAGEIARIGEVPKRSLVPGGRVDHPYEFTLRDIKACVGGGGWKLLRWEIDKRACQEAVKIQLELNPNSPPSLPGIEITQTINVSVRASARIG